MCRHTSGGGALLTEPVVYRSRVRIEVVKGPLRRAYLPAEEEPALFGVHSEIAQHYGVDMTVQEPHAATGAAPARPCGVPRSCFAIRMYGAAERERPSDF